MLALGKHGCSGEQGRELRIRDRRVGEFQCHLDSPTGGIKLQVFGPDKERTRVVTGTKPYFPNPGCVVWGWACTCCLPAPPLGQPHKAAWPATQGGRKSRLQRNGSSCPEDWS
jgi:hypothetical protein